MIRITSSCDQHHSRDVFVYGGSRFAKWMQLHLNGGGAIRTDSKTVRVRLFHLQELDVGDEIVNVLLAGWIVNRIQILEARAPDRHVFRAMCSKASAKY